MSKIPYTIAISGPSGAGKTTLANALVNLLGDALPLGIDDYPEEGYPDAAGWIERGANPDEFETPGFFEDVRNLKSGKIIFHPAAKEMVEPPAYLVIEEPFGRSRSALKDLIDFHVEIVIPLEIALARRSLRILERKPESEKAPFIQRHLEWYLRIGREFYLAVQKNAREGADLSIDGTLPAGALAQKILEAVMLKRGN